MSTDIRVSAIMPTADRRRFVPGAIAAFLAQGREDSELVILDDGDDPVADLVPADPRIRYVRETGRRVLGDKRNRLCELARGGFILHWDDDDWHAPDRIVRQFAALEASGADMCGLDRVTFLADDGAKAWDYVYEGGRRWVCGGSLAYRRAFWEDHRFPAIASGEDTDWVFSAAGASILVLDAPDLYVGRVHDGNTSPKATSHSFYRPRDPGPVRIMVEGFDSAASSRATPAKAVANVYACLVHERPECVVDLVRNLRHLDAISPILLYDGSADGDLLDPRLPWRRWGAEIVAGPSPMQWGTLHGFALDCLRHLEGREHDVMTIVDSDQLMLRGGYAEYLAERAGGAIRGQLLSCDPTRQTAASRQGPAHAALAEIALWRPWLARFPDGEAKFVHWTFWPGTAIGADVGRAILPLFGDPDLQAILAGSKLWATEEVLFPTFAALLGFEVVRNPCRTDFVQYRTPWTDADLDRALDSPDAFFIHPVPRRLDNGLRARLRDRHGGYRIAPPAPPPAAPGSSLGTLLAAMREIDGWLTDEEGEALFVAAREVLAGAGAAGRIVEIGSHCGKATYLLAEAARAAPIKAVVTAIDRFDGLVGSRDKPLERFAASRARFDHMVARHGLAGWIDVRTGEAPALRWSGTIDLLIVDGLHDYAAVAADFCAFEAWLGPEARVAFHDYADYYPGVCAFVDELVASGGWKIEIAAVSLRILGRAEPASSEAAMVAASAA
ncbi:MAG: glycosyltransferase [Allosphingosinicella sp.]